MTDIDQKELIALATLVDKAAYLRKYGSYSQRNPTLGKMRTCPYCGTRKRGEEVCCNVRYVAIVSSEAPRLSKIRKNPRLTRNNPPLFLVHQRLLELERTPGFKDYKGLTGIVEAGIKKERRKKAKKITDQQKLSRKLNRREARRG